MKDKASVLFTAYEKTQKTCFDSSQICSIGL